MKTEIINMMVQIKKLKSEIEDRKWTDDNNGVEALFSIEGMGHYLDDIEQSFERDEAIKMLTE